VNEAATQAGRRPCHCHLPLEGRGGCWRALLEKSLATRVTLCTMCLPSTASWVSTPSRVGSSTKRNSLQQEHTVTTSYRLYPAIMTHLARVSSFHTPATCTGESFVLRLFTSNTASLFAPTPDSRGCFGLEGPSSHFTKAYSLAMRVPS